jgi:Xaa-Pro aminopeptidase/Xaa-Pro dipeptidase
MVNQALKMTAPPDTYRQRRAELAARLNRPMVILAGEGRARQHATNTHPFRAGSNYLYFGGPPVAGAALFIEPGSDGESGCALVRRMLGFEDAVWIGDVPTDDRLASAAGVPEGNLVAPDQFTAHLKGRRASFVCPPCPPSLEWAASLRLEPATPDELQPIIDLRLIKDEHELAAMRKAARISVEAHLAAMKATAPGRREADVAAAFMAVLVANQCRPSFTPIVSVHGEVLHSESYPNALHAGGLLIVDAGAEEPGGYACDITRTYPVSGKFTPIQRQLYDTVLRAHGEAVAACVPGKRYREIHDLAARVLCEGLVEADLLRGDPDNLVARAAHTLFFPHGVGHLIGLDVHDMEDFGDLAGYAPGRERRPEFGSKYLRLDRDLQPGMTVTIEPGLYMVPAIWRRDGLLAPLLDVVNRQVVDALLAEGFGGIRIEDTILIGTATEQGPAVLTADLPTDHNAVAALVSGR